MRIVMIDHRHVDGRSICVDCGEIDSLANECIDNFVCYGYALAIPPASLTKGIRRRETLLEPQALSSLPERYQYTCPPFVQSLCHMFAAVNLEK
jgi:hypothetical protein